MLYELDRENPERSTRISIRSPDHFNILEKVIEDFVRFRLSETVSEDHLMLIGQERKWQEEADLLALDKEGTLYIFELKRWQSQSENILQVMRYGQILGRYTYQKLENLAKGQKIVTSSMVDEHKEHFGLKTPIDKSQFNKKQHFVLVTNGVDADTISAVDYWSTMGVKISCSPYRLYEINGKPYLQFDTFNPNGEIVVETNSQYFIVNTNSTWDEMAYRDMLGDGKTGKAAAYGSRKSAVCNIPKNSVIYLYHTTVGVIAKGKATDTFQRIDYEDDTDGEFFVPLDFEWSLDQNEWQGRAVRPSDINERLNSGHRFRQTAFAISEDVAQAIDEIAEEKR